MSSFKRSPWRDGPLGKRVAGQIAWWLPREVVYFVLIRAWAHATSGRYGSTEVTEVTADEVVRRWGTDNSLSLSDFGPGISAEKIIAGFITADRICRLPDGRIGTPARVRVRIKEAHRG